MQPKSVSLHSQRMLCILLKRTVCSRAGTQEQGGGNVVGGQAGKLTAQRKARGWRGSCTDSEGYFKSSSELRVGICPGFEL